MPHRPQGSETDRLRIRRRRLVTLAAAYASLGGAIAGWLLVSALRSIWAFPIGLAVMLALVLASGRRSATRGATVLMLGYAFAFALLTWPVLVFLAGLLSGEWEGN